MISKTSRVLGVTAAL